MEKQTIETKPAQAGCGWRVILQTPRLFLREMTEQDFDALYGILGDCGLTMQNVDGTILPEIGYHLARAHQRQGYAREAARACRDWTFAHTPFGIVYSYMKEENAPSSAVARANGMQLLRVFTDSEGEQTAVYAITRVEWMTL